MTSAFRLGPSAGTTSGASRSFDERVRAVGFAAMAYWYYRWDWGESIALDGLDACASLVDEPMFSEWVNREVDSFLETADTIPVSPMGPFGAVVRRLDLFTGHSRRAADRLLNELVEYVREASGRSGALTHERDSELVFVDSLYGLPSVIAGLARTRGDERLLRDLLNWVERHCDLLQASAGGLFAHYATVSGDTPGVAWGRGNGWAALGLADLLEVVGPENAPGIAERFRTFVTALLAHEVAGGGWRNVIDQPASYPETSTTAMVVAGLSVADPVVPIGENGQAALDRGWSCIADRVDPNGHVVGVSYRPGINTDIGRYERTPVIGAYPWGQGAWLRAAATASLPAAPT